MDEIADVLLAIIVLAGIMLFTRPGSSGPSLVKSLTTGFSSSLKVATGA